MVESKVDRVVRRAVLKTHQIILQKLHVLHDETEVGCRIQCVSFDVHLDLRNVLDGCSDVLFREVFDVYLKVFKLPRPNPVIQEIRIAPDGNRVFTRRREKSYTIA